VLGALALAAFAALGQNVFSHESGSLDGAVQNWVLAHRHPVLEQTFHAVTVAGGITAMWILAVLCTLFLLFRGKHHVVFSVLVAPAISNVILGEAKRLYARPRPAGLGHGVDSSYSFPSGHATTSAAVCCTLAFVFWREGFINRGTAIAFAVLVPLIVGLSRVFLNVHWATDVLGGWSVGLLIAVLSCTLYGGTRRVRDTWFDTPSTSRNETE
jgi:membrane-associated phospholipid phosphatase